MIIAIAANLSSNIQEIRKTGSITSDPDPAKRDAVSQLYKLQADSLFSVCYTNIMWVLRASLIIRTFILYITHWRSCGISVAKEDLEPGSCGFKGSSYSTRPSFLP